MTRVLVTGGRNFTDRPAMFRALDTLAQLFGPLFIIEGAARGADAAAARWAECRSSDPAVCSGRVTVPADWSRHGKRAGPIRNTEMLVLHRPNIVLAAPGGTGTADMVRKAKAAGLPVYDLESLRC